MSLLTVREVQERLRVSRACVYALIASGQLAAIRIGLGRGTIRIDADDLNAFLASRRIPVQPANRRATGGNGFIHLDADRLRHAWTGDE